MIVKVKKIGNSKGIILPKNLLEMCDIEGLVSLTVVDNHIEIAAITDPRANWETMFSDAMKETNHTELEGIDHAENDFDQTEWEW